MSVKGKKKKRYLNFKTIIALLIASIHMIPIYLTVVISLKEKTELSSRWVITDITFDNFKFALEEAKMLLALQNSFIITFFSVLLVAIIGAMAAYPLARSQSLTNRVVLNSFLSVMMIPPLSILVPLLRMMAKLGAVSTYWGTMLVLVTFQLPICIFLYANFIHTIPRDLDQAALIDGCSPYKVFFYIILPLLKPVTATIVILSGVAIWNDYQFSLFLLQSPKLSTVTLAVSTFFSETTSNLGPAAASAIIALMPIMVLYIFLQKYFIKGAVDSAVK